MLGFQYLKSEPTQFIQRYRGSRLIQEGAGLSFLYWAPVATIVKIPLTHVDMPFAFQESTKDFQPVTLQGQVSFRISDPAVIASRLNFSLNMEGNYKSDDFQKLCDRLVNITQVHARESVSRRPLKEALVSSESISKAILEALREDSGPQSLGIEAIGVSILSIKTSPELTRALESEAREAIQKRSDEAIFERRQAAVENERKIKETELRTNLMVEEKQRLIRETQIQADISVEDQRRALVDLKVESDKKEADSRAYALEQSITPIRDVDWKVLTAAFGSNMDPQAMIALSFREMAENAGKIGELNITSELLQSLLSTKGK